METFYGVKTNLLIDGKYFKTSSITWLKSKEMAEKFKTLAEKAIVPSTNEHISADISLIHVRAENFESLPKWNSQSKTPCHF